MVKNGSKRPGPKSLSGTEHILKNPGVRSWIAYDWANSAFFTVVVSTLFPIYFTTYICQGFEEGKATYYFSVATTLGALLIALASPFLGTVADKLPIKKTLLFVFASLGCLATASLATTSPDHPFVALILFSTASFGVMGSLVFYDSLLPHICPTKELNKVSTTAYAAGYVSGTILLAAVFLCVSKPALVGLGDKTSVSKAAYVVVAAWWFVFSLPLLLRLKEPAIATRSSVKNALKSSTKDLLLLVKKLKQYPDAFRFLLAFLVYNDGIGTVIKMAAIYGAELHLKTSTLMGAILLVQFIGIPFTLLFSKIADKLGIKTTLNLALAVYIVVCVVGYFAKTDSHFYALALLIGVVQGGTQSLSRSLFASMIPRDSSGQFFGLYAVFEKLAGVLGPLLFTLAIAFTGQTKLAILGLVFFFVLGAIVLSTVDVERGRKQVGVKF